MNTPTVSGDLVTWFCSDCGAAIADGDGYLGVDTHDADRIGALWRAHREAHPTGSTLAEMPSETETAWYALHHGCGPEHEPAAEYAIDVAQVRSTGNVLYWTGHLMEKTWLANTNWNRLAITLGTPS